MKNTIKLINTSATYSVLPYTLKLPPQGEVVQLSIQFYPLDAICTIKINGHELDGLCGGDESGLTTVKLPTEYLKEGINALALLQSDDQGFNATVSHSNVPEVVIEPDLPQGSFDFWSDASYYNEDGVY